jgi:hypothetical protein
VIARSEQLSRRRALVGASSLVALSALPSLPAIGAIPVLFAEWQAAWGPYIAALKEYGHAEEAWFSDESSPEKKAAMFVAEAAMEAAQDTVIDLENGIFEAPAVTLADLRSKLLIRSKTIGMGDGDIQAVLGDRNQELLLRLLADVERLTGKAAS